MPLIIAHRGASGYRPEHTRSGYELAFALGADAVEPDIVASRDGVLVIRHENEISGTTDVSSRPEFAARRITKTVDGATLTGWFTEDFTWQELSTLRTTERLPGVRRDNTAFDGRDGILRLEDLLAMLDASDREIGLIAEIKHASYFSSLGLPLDEILSATLAAAGWHDDARLTIESFELTALERIRARGVRARFVYLLEAGGSPADRPEQPYASWFTDAGLAGLAGVVDGISIDKELLLTTDDAGVPTTTDLVARAHAAGLLVYCWTLRAENRFLMPQHRSGGSKLAFGDWVREFELIMSSGVDGVFADQPDLALEVRSRLA